MPVIGKEVAHFSEENAAQIQEVEQEIHEIREAALEAGKSTEALNESGQWTAMQRIEELVDEGTWCPLNSLYNPQDNDNGSVGIVKGLGRINGKWAVIIASDNKKLAGAWVPGQADALLRGSRQSVAVLSGRETEAQLEGLADDIWAYSGLGCRSVSLLFVPEGYDLRLRMPAVNEKYRNNYRQQKALLTMTGRPFRDLGSAVAVEERAFPAALSRIACSRYKTLGEVEAWLAQHDAELQCVVSECVSHGRRTGFGRAQFPALTDYPDDRDVIAFLAALN